ncbi:MAG: cupin domain-containing protein [Candidatus Nomurabacteria bacterium]|jgi:mannose-6-phosphate isomerase-like protein (cupin superfamily)|nr:cupin domain-containing protein [Candidatus Nomurabacteria bacterium]
MKIIKKSDAEIIKHGGVESAEYNTGNADLNMAVVTVNGRHPKQNYTMNTECKEILYFINGRAQLFMKNADPQELAAGDIVLIEPNESYYWQGDFTAVTSCSPAWTIKQVKEVK